MHLPTATSPREPQLRRPGCELRRATREDRVPLQRLLELYQYELSDVWEPAPPDLDAHGEYGYPLDDFWAGTAVAAYLLRVDGCWAGFALVTSRVYFPGGDHWLEQFFLMKKYRRRGLGAAMAAALFDSRPGQWQLAQFARNLPAQAFWRATLAEYTQGRYVETPVHDPVACMRGPVQQFLSASG